MFKADDVTNAEIAEIAEIAETAEIAEIAAVVGIAETVGTVGTRVVAAGMSSVRNAMLRTSSGWLVGWPKESFRAAKPKSFGSL
jgi:isopropylmalate/homocitrate/citramalate synthase